MICPLMSWGQEIDEKPFDCLKEKCAWWVEKITINQEGECAIKMLAEKETSNE